MGEVALAPHESVRGEQAVAVEGQLLALRASEAPQEQWSRARYGRWAGELVMRDEAIAKSMPPTITAAECIDSLAADPSLRGTEIEHLVDINVATAVIEACFKSRHRKQVPLTVNEQGEFVQFGQTAQQMHRNSIVERPHRRPELQAFTYAEALNGHRAEDLNRAGMLDDYWLIVPSLVPTDLPEKDLGAEGDGYFLSSMTFALQGTTKEAGEIVVESIFDSGIEDGEPLTYQQRQAQRFDIAAIEKVYERFGLEAPDGPLGYLQNPLLIHKSLLKNGMVDFLRMVHEASDEVLSRTVEHTEDEYLAIIEQSAAREASLEETMRKVKEDLLGYAGTFTKPLDAIDRLWKIVKQHVVNESVLNEHINPNVFGKEAEEAIQRARLYASMGDMAAMEQELAVAHEKAIIVGCGGGASGKSAGGGGEASAASGEQEDIPKEIRCIKCGKFSPREKVVGKDSWHCPHCQYEVDICTGAVMHESVQSKPAPDQPTPVTMLFDYISQHRKQAA